MDSSLQAARLLRNAMAAATNDRRQHRPAARAPRGACPRYSCGGNL